MTTKKLITKRKGLRNAKTPKILTFDDDTLDLLEKAKVIASHQTDRFDYQATFPYAIREALKLYVK